MSVSRTCLASPLEVLSAGQTCIDVDVGQGNGTQTLEVKVKHVAVDGVQVKVRRLQWRRTRPGKDIVVVFVVVFFFSLLLNLRVVRVGTAARDVGRF